METGTLLVVCMLVIAGILLIDNWVNPVTDEQRKNEALYLSEILIKEKEEQLLFMKEEYQKLKGA
jgi:hypothetical protein